MFVTNLEVEKKWTWISHGGRLKHCASAKIIIASLKINQFGNVDLRLQQIYKSRDNILNFYPVTKAY